MSNIWNVLGLKDTKRLLAGACAVAGLALLNNGFFGFLEGMGLKQMPILSVKSLVAVLLFIGAYGLIKDNI